MTDASIPIWLYYLAGSVIIILLGIIGYFFKRTIDSMDKLSSSVEKLSLTTTSLRGTIESIDDDLIEHKSDNKEAFIRINDQLGDHTKKLENHSIDIARLKEKINK